MKRLVNVIPQVLLNLSKVFSRGHRSFLGPGCEEKWCAALMYKSDSLSDMVAEEKMLLFTESGHPVFRGSRPLSVGKHRYITTRNLELQTYYCSSTHNVSLICSAGARKRRG